MSEQQRQAVNSPKTTAVLQAVHSQQKPIAPTLQTDPLEQVTCRLGDASCAGAHASRLSRATASQAPRSADSLLKLQRSYGNRYVRRVMTLARAGEGEAEVGSEVESAIQAARGSGQALDSAVRARMEPAFGVDFSGVRVHADGQADTLSRHLNARAFTTGRDIFFKQGEYSPGGSSGRELLAHELTHVVQQNGDQAQPKLALGQVGDRYEQEADRVARSIIELERQPELGLPGQSQVQRQPEDEEEESAD